MSQKDKMSKSCVEKIEINTELDKYVHALQHCSWNFKSYLTSVQTHLEVPKNMISEVIKSLVSVTDDFEKVKAQFSDTFHKIQKSGSSESSIQDVDSLLNCKSIRKEAMQMLGSVCAPRKQVKGGTKEGGEIELGLDVVRTGFWISLVLVFLLFKWVVVFYSC